MVLDPAVPGVPRRSLSRGDRHRDAPGRAALRGRSEGRAERELGAGIRLVDGRPTGRPCGASRQGGAGARHAPRRVRGAVPTADGLVGYPLVSPSGVGTIEFIAKAPSTVRLRFAATPPRARQGCGWPTRTPSCRHAPRHDRRRRARRDPGRTLVSHREDRSRRDVRGGRHRPLQAARRPRVRDARTRLPSRSHPIRFLSTVLRR